MPWDKIHVFWGDERFVAPHHSESNFGQAENQLFSKVPIPPQNLHPIKTSYRNVIESALKYEQNLRRFFNENQYPSENEGSDPSSSILQFDLLMLGLGADGHIASLFPLERGLSEKERWVIDTQAPASYAIRQRISMTFPLIEKAREILFLVQYRGKEAMLDRIFKGQPNDQKGDLPIFKLNPAGKVTWMVLGRDS